MTVCVVAKVFAWCGSLCLSRRYRHPHQSELTHQWNIDNDINTFDWPAQPPQLNILENVLLTIKIRLSRVIKDIRTKQDLISVVLGVWQHLPSVYIWSLYSPIQVRIRYVIVQKGYITKYWKFGVRAICISLNKWGLNSPIQIFIRMRRPCLLQYFWNVAVYLKI